MVHNPYLAALFISVMQATTTIFYSEWSFSSVTLQLVVASAVCGVVIGITVWLFPMKTLLWLLLSETAKVHNMELYYNLIAVLIRMQSSWVMLFSANEISIFYCLMWFCAILLHYKKLSYRRGTARCVVSVEILPIATRQCRNYLYDKSWPNRWYEVEI